MLLNILTPFSIVEQININKIDLNNNNSLLSETHGPAFSYKYLIASGITPLLFNLGDSANGIISFIESMLFTIQTISKITGFRVILLLLCVLLLSSVFSLFGIPKDRTSFFISLIISDFIWFTWGKSLNPEIFDLVISILHTNLILLIPFFSVLLLKKTAPFFSKTILKLILSFIRIPFLSRRVNNKKQVIYISEKYGEISHNFLKSLLKDLLYIRNDKIILSNETCKYIKELDDIQKELNKFILNKDG